MPANPHLEADIATILTSARPLTALPVLANNPEYPQPLSAGGEGALLRPSKEAGERLIVLVGLPGTGKSTFARRLAPLIDAVILESDALRRQIFATPTYAETESNRLFRAIQAATQRLLLEGRSVIIDATNLRETHRKPFYDIAAKTGARLHVVHLTAPEDVSLNRLAHRRNVADPNEASTAYEAVYALLEQQEEPPRGAHLRIDTSDDVAIDAALRTLVAEGRPLSAAAHGGIS